MLYNVKVPWETRLGRVGAKEIESRLSYFSKTTEEELDVGIDFRCELIEDDAPSIPFFVQAKGTQHFDQNWGQGIRKSTILYWLRQRFPVYLIVYDEKSGNCYWMSIESQRYSLFRKLGKSDSDTVYIKVDKSNLLEKGRDKNRKFIQKIKDDLNSTKLFFGHPQFKGNGYIKIVPGPPRSIRELVLIKENVRMGLYSFIIHYLNQGGLQNAYLCCSFLTRFDKSHYNHFVWFGKINKALGKNPEAKSSFEEALRICEGDKNWPRESMKNITALIRQEIESCT